MKFKTLIIALSVVFIFGSVSEAQTTSIFTTGLTLPNKIINAGDNSLLVSEAGTTTPNTGRVSLVDRTTGARQTLISGLPSGVNNLGGAPTSSGPSGLRLQGHTLDLTIAGGDAVQNIGGVEIQSPTPSSQLFNSVLELVLPGNYEEATSAFALSGADQTALANGASITIANAGGQKVEIRMVANFPDYIPNRAAK